MFLLGGTGQSGHAGRYIQRRPDRHLLCGICRNILEAVGIDPGHGRRSLHQGKEAVQCAKTSRSSYRRPALFLPRSDLGACSLPHRQAELQQVHAARFARPEIWRRRDGLCFLVARLPLGRLEWTSRFNRPIRSGRMIRKPSTAMNSACAANLPTIEALFNVTRVPDRLQEQAGRPDHRQPAQSSVNRSPSSAMLRRRGSAGLRSKRSSSQPTISISLPRAAI